ncbi:MAG: hypothetical protein IJC67_07170 [Clostridia bacterium]|nr:hypothetical protein [Clostridia bacterium]
MMFIALLPGLAAFGLMILYDWLQAYRGKHRSILLFAGALLLILSTVWLLILADLPASFQSGVVRFVIGACGALASTACMVYALFFALPFSDTYTASGKKTCVYRGWYALCRHPAAFCCYFVYAFLLLMAPALSTLLALLILPNMNLVYVALEDRYFFPRTIEGYDSYKQTTPFLIPTRASVKRMQG